MRLQNPMTALMINTELMSDDLIGQTQERATVLCATHFMLRSLRKLSISDSSGW